MELTPVRLNAVAGGLVDTPLLCDGLDARQGAERDAADRAGRYRRNVAALLLHATVNTAITGAVLAIDGGQSLLLKPRAAARIRASGRRPSDEARTRSILASGQR